jgi:hypothetical protein
VPDRSSSAYRNRQQAGLDLAPFESTDFIAPTASQQQEFDDASRSVLPTSVPDNPDFIVGQDSITRQNAGGRIVSS